MNEPSAPRIAKLPFLLGDLLLVASGAWIALHGGSLGQWQYAAMVGAVAFGAWLLSWPFVLQFRAATRLAESTALSNVTSKIQDLDKVSGNISQAVTEWQHLQKSATDTVAAAEQIAERMTVEAHNFGEVLSKLNDGERNHLRLEVEKLRRVEGDWLGITVRLLDHVYALHRAGVRSGQRNVIEQLTSFQHACRDTARRTGLLAVVTEVGAPFDDKIHALMEGVKPTATSVVDDVIAPGYTFQGQLIRLPLVTLREATVVAEEKPVTQLSLLEKSDPS